MRVKRYQLHPLYGATWGWRGRCRRRVCFIVVGTQCHPLPSRLRHFHPRSGLDISSEEGKLQPFISKLWQITTISFTPIYYVLSPINTYTPWQIMMAAPPLPSQNALGESPPAASSMITAVSWPTRLARSTCSSSAATWDWKEQGCGGPRGCNCFPPASGTFQDFWTSVHSYVAFYTGRKKQLWHACWPAIAGNIFRRIENWD